MRRHAALLCLLLAACADPPPAEPLPPSAATAPAPDTATPAAEHAPPPAPLPPPIPPAAGELSALAAPSDTLASLRARHGADNVIEAPLPLGPGSEEPGWMLFADDPQRVAMIQLDAQGRPVRLELGGERSVWSVQGVRLGMPLPELQALNGGPLTIAGFRGDLSGTVQDWRGGHLAGSGLVVRLCVPSGGIPAAYPLSDSPFASDDPRVAVVVPTVCNLGQRLAADAAR